MTTYFIIQNLLFLICTYVGWSIGKKEGLRHSYWSLALIVLLVFTIIEGIRFGRGIDYNLYFRVYDDIAKGFMNDINHEFMFVLLCKIFSFLYLPYQSLIIFSSFLLIFSGLYFLKDHGKTMLYSLPLFVYSTLLAENLIRWFFSFSIILFGLYWLNKGSFKKYILFSFLGFSFHYGVIIVIPVYYLLSRFERPILKPTYAIIIYLLLYLLWENSYFIFFQQYVQLFSGVERFGNYIQDSKDWLTGSNRGEFMMGTLTYIRYIFTHIFLILAGFKVVQIEKKILLYYNILLLGIILFPIFNGVELFYRIDQVLIVFQFLVAGYCFYYIIGKKIVVHKSLLIFTYLILFFYIFNAVRITMELDPNRILYLWDAHGRNNLPIDLLERR